MNKVIVVGGGILGASTAYMLTKMGADVTVVDRNDRGQATAAAAGIICPWVTQRRNKAWYQLVKAGARFYPRLIQALKEDGEHETGYSRVGALILHKELGKLDKLEERALEKRQEAPEMGEIRKLSSPETSSLFPPLIEEFSALQVTGAARVDGRLLRDSLLRAAVKNGARVINGSAELKYEGKQINGVYIDDQTIQGNLVIVCAGAWANELFSPLGIHFGVSFQKAQILHLEMPNASTENWPVVMPPGNQYLLAFEEGKIVAGATHEDLEEFDTRITAGGLRELLNKAIDAAPGLESGTFVEARTGFRPFTPGFLPVIGPLPGWDGLIVANGLGASGLTMGPYIGEQLARMAMGAETEIDINLYPVEGAIISEP
ncbi:oxidoreductase [Mesobacillus campisalis]|uniref:Oxidoreductase n=1 Tax=Mesobacillus campisalis TaxID=1408103 RepID=A0A0M2SWC3_9BACI|nr:FAD-dependent oxidoreductase [Mesobacillus campisalis]KKK38463.1 oxidoreductase [Mesobacillus campisalis]